MRRWAGVLGLSFLLGAEPGRWVKCGDSRLACELPKSVVVASRATGVHFHRLLEFGAVRRQENAAVGLDREPFLTDGHIQPTRDPYGIYLREVIPLALQL
jgi:hypothetical protein